MKEEKRKLHFKMFAICLSILLLGTFWLTLRMAQEPLSMVVEPTAPRQGEPVLVTFRLNNPSSQALPVHYQFYTNGEILAEGSAVVASHCCETYQYSHEYTFAPGEQLIFLVRTHSELGDFDKIVSLPYVPPQIWSSFVSIGAFSSAMMTSISTMTYYNSMFGTDTGLNTGVILAVTLVILLMFLELSQPVLARHNMTVLVQLRGRVRFVSWILLVIAMGIIYSVMIILITR